MSFFRVSGSSLSLYEFTDAVRWVIELLVYELRRVVVAERFERDFHVFLTTHQLLADGWLAAVAARLVLRSVGEDFKEKNF